jgi:hypothetical protein
LREKGEGENERTAAMKPAKSRGHKKKRDRIDREVTEREKQKAHM